MFWYIDIGIYINSVLFLFLIFLLIKRKFKFSIILLISIVGGWTTLYYYIPNYEFEQFFINVKLAISTIDQIQGLIFPTPFLSLDTRATKALILFLITGFLIITEINNNKKMDLKFLLVVCVFL